MSVRVNYLLPWVSLWSVCLWSLCLVDKVDAQNQAVVATVGGGPIALGGTYYGDLDGKTKETAQFHTPWGCALDNAGYLYIADRDNGKIRRLDIAGDTTRTLASSLPRPVAVAVDPNNSLYVACLGTNVILRLDRFITYALGSNLQQPSAVALRLGADGRVTDIYVAELGNGGGGAVRRIDPQTQAVSLVLGGLNQPQGLAMLDNGLLAVSETGAHTIRFVDPDTGAVIRQIGSNPPGPGFRDGLLETAKFNTPVHLAKAPDGSLVVADCGNDCVRVITADGYVGTLYGIDPALWGFDNPTGYLGWWDGTADLAEARQPSGVTVAPDGTVYATEIYYHIIRQVTSTGLASSTNSANTNVVVSAPILAAPGLSLLAGYYPMGLNLYVTNLNSSPVLDTHIYYTTDGTDPTTNSLEVLLTNNVGILPWRETLRDLSSLRVKTFLGAASSTTVAGQAVTQTQIGATRDVSAGIGALVLIPVVVDLKSGDTLRSLQYRVEVTPASPRPNIDAVTLQCLSSTNEPFLRIAGGAGDGKTATYLYNYYNIDKTQGAAIAYLGTNSNLQLQNFGVANLLAIRIPTTAVEGDRYTIQTLAVSGTSDGVANNVSVSTKVPCSIVVTNLPYLVGESTPASWYNAGDFGIGSLKNSDVNNAYYASLGVRTPFPFTDVFDAMDAYPPDSPATGKAGGDGQIRYLDWQTILVRSLKLPDAGPNVQRCWSLGGARIALNPSGTLAAHADSPVQPLSLTNGTASWYRQALVGALALDNVANGKPLDVPVYVIVQPGCSLSGMQFRVLVTPEGPTPGLDTAVQFVPGDNIPDPGPPAYFSNGDLACAWDVGAFNPPLTGSNYLGSLRIPIPRLADPGQSLMVRFANADGAPNLATQYDFETRSARIYIGWPAPQPQSQTSDEWKIFFFGSTTNAWAADNADPDGDGISNLMAYRGGINPAQLHLFVLSPAWQSGLTSGGFTLRWFGSAGQHYLVESKPAVGTTPWTVLRDDFIGAGSLLEMADTNLVIPVKFYRVRQSP